MDKSGLIEYLSETMQSLNEMYDEINRTAEEFGDKELENDIYESVGQKIEQSVESLNIIINDLESGSYDSDTFEDEE